MLDKTYYQVLQVGPKNNMGVDYLRDDMSDNIAEKNPNYCELTGLYWIWKNGQEKTSDIVGLVHYRRYFTTRLEDFLYTYFDKKPRILSGEKVLKSLNRADIILPVKVKIMRTVREYYGDAHWIEDLDILRDVIKELHPEYLAAYDQVMQAHSFYYANMMICSKEIFDEYAAWLFSLMDRLESKIDLNKYEDDYQRRIFGFLAERLLQVWVEKKGLKVKEFPAFNTEQKRLTVWGVNRNRFEKLFRKILHVKGQH